MRYCQYYAGGKLLRISLQGITEQPRRARRASKRSPSGPRPDEDPGAIIKTMHAQHSRLSSRFHELSESSTFIASAQPLQGTIIPTQTISIDRARSAELKWAQSKFGLETVREGRHGKVLMRIAGDTEDMLGATFDIARALHERGRVGSAHPNFLRLLQRPTPSVSAAVDQWALNNSGTVGLVGADVHALAAWTITRGDPAVRVAVLDEGVDTSHPYLQPAVVDEADFVDGNAHARPDGDDAHGTACAGIVVSRGSKVDGLASGASLVAVRIAKSNAQGFWIFDDFETADAIDWAWDDARSDVLSNSWGGGPPADVITRAFERARTQGRGGKGSVIVVAAGNAQSLIDFPGNLPEVLTVGASNQWDARKTKNSKDGENWWGSNYGDTLDLLAPGVEILTTDIKGARGYTGGLTTPNFNGTSSAAPHVAAAAALILSTRPDLKEKKVRELINETADHLSPSGWTKLVGHGRLNTYLALRAAARA